MSRVRDSEEEQPSETFVRVLDPSDPWVFADRFNRAQRQENFRGRLDWDISVAMACRCPPVRVLASFHGARRDAVLDSPAYYVFDGKEVSRLGGRLDDTDAVPPWPEDYNHAHHDVCDACHAVSRHMADRYEKEPNRVTAKDEEEVLVVIAGLLREPNVPQRFKKHASYRFRRMFEDGGDRRSLWGRVANKEKVLLEDPSVRTSIRRMYQDLSSRGDWTVLMDEVGLPVEERGQFR